MEGLRILSFNVNGLNDYHKRKDIFDYLRKQNAHIFFLQETHLNKDSVTKLCKINVGV